MSRKTLISLIVVIAIVAASAFMVAAQDDNDDADPTYFGPGWMHQQWDGESFGPGMMWGGMHGGFGPGMMWDEDNTMMSAIAEALGMELDALYTAFSNGQSLADIAEAQGVELETVTNAAFAQAETHMAELVEAGYFTQEEADARLVWMRENFETMPMFGAVADFTPPCWGGEATGFGPGMMGHGRGRGRGWGTTGN